MPLLLPLVLLLPEGGAVPVFDARVYADCIARMATHPSWSTLVCAGHPTHAYILLTAPVLALAPTNPWLLLVAHLAFLLAGLWAFRRIHGQLFPDPAAWWERDLVTAVLAVNPVLLGSTLHYNPDLAAFTFALLTWTALLDRRIALAALSGLALVFTKEIGILLLAVLLAIHVLGVTRAPGEVRAKLRGLSRDWPLLLPFVIFVGRSWTTDLVVPPDNESGAHAILSEFVSVRLLDGVFLSYAAAVLVLHFQWVPALVIGAWVTLAAARWAFGRPAFANTNADADANANGTLALVMFLAVFTVTTRYRTYSSPRYLLAVYPMMLLATMAAARALGASARLRTVGLAGFALLSLASVRATIDPFSRAVYGTFAFGDHTMLQATSITSYTDASNSGYGRDQLVNNLQSAIIPRLQDDILKSAAGTPTWPFVMDDANLWFLWGTFDGNTHRRTFSLDGPQLPLVSVNRLLRDPVPDCLYALYPMFADIQGPLVQKLQNFYDIVQRTPIDDHGYRVELLTLHLDDARWHTWSESQPRRR